MFLFSHTCFLHLKHQLLWTLSFTVSGLPEQMELLHAAPGFQELCLTHNFLSFLFGVLEHWSMDVSCLKDSLSSEKHAHNLKRYLAICHAVKILREDKTSSGEKKKSVEAHTETTSGSESPWAENNGILREYCRQESHTFALDFFFLLFVLTGTTGDTVLGKVETCSDNWRQTFFCSLVPQRQVSYHRIILMLKWLLWSLISVKTQSQLH